MKWHDAKKEWPPKIESKIIVYDKPSNSFSFLEVSTCRCCGCDHLMLYENGNRIHPSWVKHWCYVDDIPKPE